MQRHVLPIERRDARENRARILRAAREEFARRGLGAEMKDIATRAGLGVGTLYRHFESREGLLSAIIDQIHDDLIERVAALSATDPPHEALRGMIRAGAEVIDEFGAMMEVFSGALEHDGARRAEVQRLFSGLIVHGIDRGVFRDDLDVGVLMSAVEAVFKSGALLAMAEEHGSVQAAADAFADLLMRGCSR